MKFTSRPVLVVACNLTLVLGILATLPSCSKAKNTPQSAGQAGATQSASASALNGYWVEQSVPAGQVSPRNHTLKPTSIFIQNGQFFDIVKYSDGTVDQIDAQISAPSSADANGNFIIAGTGSDETIKTNGNTLAIEDVETHKDVKTTTYVVYVKTDQNTAGQHARPLWFKKKSDYAFATQFCDNASKLEASSTAMLNQINQFVANDIANKGTSLDKIRAERNTGGTNLSACQITEDYLERGIDYARTGVTPVYPEYAKRSTLSIHVDAKSNLAPVLALQLDDLTLISDDSGKSVVDLTPLTKITGLESLILNGIQVSGLEKLSALSNLTDLTLTGTDLADYSVLKQLPQLQGINLSNSTIAQSLSTISQLAQLDSVWLTSWSSTAQKLDISSLGNLSNLLSLGLCNDFYASLDFLPSFGKLMMLQVDLEDDTFVNMIKSLSEVVTGLKNIVIVKTVKNANDVNFISVIPNITGLDLTLSSGFHDLSAVSSKSVPTLRLLSITGDRNETAQNLPDLSGVMKLSSLRGISATNFVIPDLSIFEGFLKSNTHNSVILDSDQASNAQKPEDQTLAKEFGRNYSSELNFK